MRKAITVPVLGEAWPTVSVWYARPGEFVYAGDRVVEILLGGATVDLSAPCTGHVAEWLVFPAEKVCAGQVVGTIDEAEDE